VCVCVCACVRVCVCVCVHTGRVNQKKHFETPVLSAVELERPTLALPRGIFQSLKPLSQPITI